VITSNSPSSHSGEIPGVLAAKWTAAASPTMLPAVFDNAQRMPFISHSSAILLTSPMLPTFGMPVLIESTMRFLITICASATVRTDWSASISIGECFFDFPQRIELVARYGLLENFHTMIREALGQSNCGLGVISLIGVDFDEHVIADCLTHSGDTGQILVYFAADFEL
jgi:hypothetical protein